MGGAALAVLAVPGVRAGHGRCRCPAVTAEVGQLLDDQAADGKRGETGCQPIEWSHQR